MIQLPRDIDECRFISGTAGMYFAGTDGHIYSLHTKDKAPKLLKGRCDGHGYLRVRIRRHNLVRDIRVHILVAEAFLVGGPIPEDKEVDHINGDRTDNRLVNLRLTSASDNKTLKDIRARLRKINQLTEEIDFELSTLEMK